MGELGLAVALLLTLPFLGRWDLVITHLAAGALLILIPLFGLMPSWGYRDLQMMRDGVRPLTASELGQLPLQPVMVRLTGIWRYDIAKNGMYISSGRSTNGLCGKYKTYFCRVPIVAADWQPDQPVLAIASCRDRGDPLTRTQRVRLVPANAPDLYLFGLESGDITGKEIYHGTCSGGPDTGHAELGSAAFRFDEARSFFAIPLESSDQPYVYIAIECLFAAGALALALRRNNWKTRVPSKRELTTPAA